MGRLPITFLMNYILIDLANGMKDYAIIDRYARKLPLKEVIATLEEAKIRIVEATIDGDYGRP